eukprot:11981676-Heterocapsa_arctica.AAC.1
MWACTAAGSCYVGDYAVRRAAPRTQPGVGASPVGFPPRRLCTFELYGVSLDWPWTATPAPAGAFGAFCSSGSCASGPSGLPPY